MSEQRLFISHASADEAVVNRIVAYLEARGVACWLAHRDIPPRSIYAEAITQALRECSACVVILSRTANESDAVKRELELASHYRKPFIPIRVDDTEPGAGVDYYLRNAQWVDYRKSDVAALERLLNSTPSSPTRATSPQRSNSSPMALIATALTIAVGIGWYAWDEFRQTIAASPNVATGAPTSLVGNWSGSIQCGETGFPGEFTLSASTATDPSDPSYGQRERSRQHALNIRANGDGILLDLSSGRAWGRWEWDSGNGFVLALSNYSGLDNSGRVSGPLNVPVTLGDFTEASSDSPVPMTLEGRSRPCVRS